mmetsp:Transcript_14944/g.23791  ORF Transcript_14944/g.23791 Transcript_14944/m.23791 type:complete len:834 (+) Transcript_14944:203-2704(+)
MIDNERQIRTISVAGSINSGKSSFLTSIISFNSPYLKDSIYKHMRTDEDIMKTTIIMTPLLKSIRKNNKYNTYYFLDTPGHSNLFQDFNLALCISDGVIITIDSIEGVTLQTKKIINSCLYTKKKIFILITKIDRLISELRLPPSTFYDKIQSIIFDVNLIIKNSNKKQDYFSFSKSNIGILSAEIGLFLTSEILNKLYHSIYPTIFKLFFPKEWIWHTENFIVGKNILKSNPKEPGSHNPIIFFAIIPIYKLYSFCLSENPLKIMQFIHKTNFSNTLLNLNFPLKNLMKFVFKSVFDYPQSTYEKFSEYFESSKHLNQLFTNSMSKQSSKKSSIFSHTAKNHFYDKYMEKKVFLGIKFFPNSYGKKFLLFGRILNGKIVNNDSLYAKNFNNIVHNFKINHFFLINCFQLKRIKSIKKGNCLVIEENNNLNEIPILITEESKVYESNPFIDKNLLKNTYPLKITIEPAYSMDLTKLLSGIQKYLKTSKNTIASVQESGTVQISGIGEFALNLMIKEICDFFSLLKVKVSNPFISLKETIECSSKFKSISIAQKSRIYMEIMTEKINLIKEKNEITKKYLSFQNDEMKHFYTQEYIMEKVKISNLSNNLWSYQVHDGFLNILSEYKTSYNDKQILKIRSTLIKAFLMACRTGPICMEPVVNINFAIQEIKSIEKIQQIFKKEISSCMKKLCHSSILISTPRILEPYSEIEVVTPFESSKMIFNILLNRRAIILNDMPIQGTLHYRILFLIPTINTIGLETDIRYHTQGQSLIIGFFKGWYIVPGYPISNQNNIKKNNIAHNYMKKIRRKKGMSEKINFSNLINESIIMKLLFNK